MRFFRSKCMFWLLLTVLIVVNCQPIFAASICTNTVAKIKSLIFRSRSFYGQRESVFYEDGTIVKPSYYQGQLAGIYVRKPGQEPVIFERTNRDIWEYSIPRRLIRLLLDGTYAGEKVLDLGIGGGKAVTQMREAGVRATGVDIFLNSTQKRLPYFHQHNMNALPEAWSGKFQLVISNFSFFSYRATRAGESSYSEGLAILKELKRVTQFGGKIALGSVSSKDVESIVSEIPGLEISESFASSSRKWTVIERIEP